jgi:hypothetical protein
MKNRFRIMVEELARRADSTGGHFGLLLEAVVGISQRPKKALHSDCGLKGNLVKTGGIRRI